MIRNNLIHLLLLLGIMICSNINIFAQVEPKPGVLADAEFIIEKERTNQLPESSRLFKKAPPPLATEKTNLSLQYRLYDPSLPFQPLEHKIKVLKDQQDRLYPLYGNYLELGHGNFWMPFLNLFLDNTKHPHYGYGLQLSHLSEGKNKYLQEYHNKASLHGKMLTKKLAIAGEIQYRGNKYPYTETLNNSKKTDYDTSLHETYHTIQATTRVHNYITDTLNYRFQGEMIHCRGQRDRQESQGEGIVQASYQLTEALQLQTEARLHTNRYRSQTQAPQRYVGSVKPVANITWNDFIATGGVNLAFQNDTSALQDKFYLYPELKVTYHWDKMLRPYIGLSGNLQKRTWYDCISQNPWLAPSAQIGHTNQSMILSVGAHSDLPGILSTHGGLVLTNEKNSAFFTNSVLEPRQFDIQYDKSATTLKLFTTLTKYSLEDALLTQLHGDYCYYYLTELPKPWHKPAYTLELSNTYNFHNKILFKNNLYWLGEIYALEPTTQATKDLPDVIDAGLGVEYIWNERFSILLNTRNLLARANRPYWHLPTDGIHVWLGVSYGF